MRGFVFTPQHADGVFALLCIAGGGGFALAARAYAVGSAAQPGAGFVPLGLGLLLAGLGAVMGLRALLGLMRPQHAEPLKPAQPQSPGTAIWRPLFAVVAAVLAFAVLMPRFGLLPATAVMVAVCCAATPAWGWRGALAAACVFAAFAWALFVWALGMALPLWP